MNDVDFSDFFGKFKISFDYLIFAIAELLPIIVISFLFPLIAFLTSKSLQKIEKSLIYIIFFSFLGLLIGYITHLSKNSALETLLPGLVVVIGVIFELFSKIKQPHLPIIRFSPVYFGGLVSSIMFIISYRYFSLLFGAGK